MCNALLQLQPPHHNALLYSYGDNATSSVYKEENPIGLHIISDWIATQCGYVNKIVTFAVTMGESSTTSSP